MHTATKSIAVAGLCVLAGCGTPKSARHPPVRVECAKPAAAPCRTVLERLAHAGIPAAEGQAGLEAGKHTLRVLVGPWAALRADPDAAALAALAPTAPRAALIAVRARPGQPAVVVVAAIDDAGLADAAQALPVPLPGPGYSVSLRNGKPQPGGSPGGDI